MAAEKVAKLCAQRNVYMNSILESCDIAELVKSTPSRMAELEARYEDISTEFTSFRDLHNQIIGLTSSAGEDEFKKQDAIRAKTSNAFYRFKSIYFENIKKNTGQREEPKQFNVRLPKLELKTFGGNLSEWNTFFDVFNSLIHNNSSLSNVNKFQYLISSLQSEPLQLVRVLPITEDNYIIAYNNLVKKYQNKRLLATHYWNEIFHSPSLKNENTKDMYRVLNIFAENLEALKSLDFPVENWDFILFNLLLQKLDAKTRNRFELEHTDIDLPTYKSLFEFLESNCRALETSNAVLVTKNAFKFSPKPNSSSLKPPVAFAYTNTLSCVLCKETHKLPSCSKFLSKSPHSRYQFVRNKNLCLNCLSSTHGVKYCKNSYSCKSCGSRHHSLLHFGENAGTSIDTDEPIPSTSGTHISVKDPSPENRAENIQALTSLAHTPVSVTLLPTAIVEVANYLGKFVPVRALIDSAATASFLTEDCLKRLGLPRKKGGVVVAGIGNVSSTRSRGIAECVIKPVNCLNPIFSLDVFVLPEICAQLPEVPVVKNSWPYLNSIHLADETFVKPAPIDLLIGAELFPLIVKAEKPLIRGIGEPMAVETIFGWVVMGKTQFNSPVVSSCCSTLDLLDKSIKKLWEVENIPNKPLTSPEDEACETFYVNTHYRNSSARYVVALPFRTKNPVFGDSRSMALRRLYSLENRLYRNSDLLSSYRAFMKNYLDSGYMSPVPPAVEREVFFIPHHCVIRDDSLSTRLRVVFDASMKSSNGVSLNDTLYKGPKLHTDIVTVLLNFRLHRFVLTADIRQMFLQILVRPEDRDFQRILWRFDRTDTVQEYKLNTVAFGVTCSPYLANRTIRQLAIDEQECFPLAAQILYSDIYVDDILTGCETLEAACNIKCELTLLMEKGGFELRKWASNSPSILSDIPIEHQQPVSFDTEKPSFVKVLGLQWQPDLDSFIYKISSLSDLCTKRTILSDLARIFDPLGFLSPLTVYAKRMIQHLWSLGLGWDQEPPLAVISQWKRFQDELTLISSLKIPRILPVRYVHCELHAFCDASEAAYAAVVYFRVLDSQGNIRVYFVLGKSKVSPLKRISLPRLELCAAVLLVDIVDFVRNACSERLVLADLCAWSDSKVTLAWIKSSPHRWQTFVGNRVTHIQDKVSPSHWRHVSSENNPADCASRGLFPAQLVEHTMWLNGPSFLLQSSASWPPNEAIDSCSEIQQEERKLVLVSLVSGDKDSVLDRFSSLNKIQRIVAFCIRFQYNARHPHARKFGSFCEQDLQEALLVLVRQVQSEVFQDIIIQIQGGKCTSKSIRKLNPFVDENGFLRVGGRIGNSSLSYDKKFPLLLPQKHRLTQLIIETVHQKHLHPGFQTLHFLILQQFWILSARKAIRHCLHNCYRCFKVNPKSVVPYMGNLPSSRISQLKPFQEVGVDYAGPFLVTLGKSRGIKSQKAYVCIFVCFATKAIHLELASDLSSEAFLAALRRFVARRGRCTSIHSDCGTNFRGASREILELMKDVVESERIKWHFNPPSAPHFGGLWEAGVKSFKAHLIRVVGAQILTFEEFYTVLVQIEALLNSRPLHPVSADPNDISALTPGHFLTLEPLTSLPSRDLSNQNINSLKRWQLLQRLHCDFWKRWQTDYLNTLQQRVKWINKTPSLKVGDLVLIKNELRPPLTWPLARVIATHLGTDGTCRVATVKTAQRTFQRPVSKLCLLPNSL